MRQRRARPKTDTPLCKDFGGLGRKGKPCHRQAGWGTDHGGEGLCRDHDEPAAALMRAVKEGFVHTLERGTTAMTVICQDLGIDESTIYRWRRDDPEFDNAVNEAWPCRDSIRSNAVEDGFFLKLVASKGTAGDYAYWLGNRRKERWQDVRQVQLGGIGGGPIEVDVADARQALLDKLIQQQERAAEAVPAPA